MSADPAGPDCCPRCGGAFQDASQGRASYEVCGSCNGLLVERGMMIPLLDALVEQLGEYIAPDGPIAPVPNSHPPGDCPECGRTMQTFGYMETRTVYLERCGPCGLNFVDSDELPTLVVMHARTTQRASAQEADRDELYEHLSRLVWVCSDALVLGPRFPL